MTNVTVDPVLTNDLTLAPGVPNRDKRERNEGVDMKPGVKPGVKPCGPLLLSSILLVSCVWVAGCVPQKQTAKIPPLEVTTVMLKPRDVPISLQYVGQTESSRAVEIRARVEGYLEKKLYREGVVVRQGAPLFQLESRPLQLAAESAEAVLLDKESLAQNARLTQERLKLLLAENAISKKDYDDAMVADRSAAAALASSRAEQARAKLNLSYARITSPLTGLVGRANLAEGSYINPASNGLLTTVAQVDPIWVNFSVSENEWLRYEREEKQGTLRFPKRLDFDVDMILSDGKSLTSGGKLNFSSPSIDTQTGAYAVRATFPNADLGVRPGQFVRVRLHGAVRPNAILVPQRSIMQGQTGKFVYVVDKDNKAEVRPVQVGDWNGDDWFITAGLKGDEQIVVGGIVKVQPGIPLQVNTTAADASKVSVNEARQATSPTEVKK